MKSLSLAAFFVIISFTAFSQHINYRDNSKKTEEAPPPAPVKEKPALKVYKDMCPGRSANLPYLNNFVDPSVVVTLKQRYMGYLYSVTSVLLAANKFKYKVSVCSDGVMREEFVDEAGTVVP